MHPSGTSAESVRTELEKILSSDGFARNDRLSKFLRFVVEHHLAGNDAALKESLIGIEVFGRTPGYDPRQDSIVRTEAAKLRTRLVRYYSEQGSGDPIAIDLPKGGYTPTFQQAAAPRKTGHPGRRLGTAVAVITLMLVIAVGSWSHHGHRSALIPIAVLPLTNLTPDSENGYFADGLTDELIRNLSIIEGLAVRSRTSSFVFKGHSHTAREVGKQLDVDYILEGSVFHSGRQLRINAQLIRVRDDFPLWSGKFDREWKDVFTIQDEISRGIVNSLRLRLGNGQRRYETSPEAYNLFLRGRAFPIQQGLVGFNLSIEPLEQAIARDASFAPAYAGLAAAHAARSGQFKFDPDIEMSKMRAAARKAIELDPLLAEAHDAMGMAYARDAQWTESEKSFRHAIRLDPGRSETYEHFAVFLLWPLNRTGEALEQLRLAERADPLSARIWASEGHLLIMRGRYDEAIDKCQKLPDGYESKTQCLARASIGKGKISEAILILKTDYDRGVPEGSQVRGYLGYAYARAGRREEAEKIAASTSSLNPFNHALIFAGLSDKDRTFESLDRAAAGAPYRMGRALVAPELALLRGDRRVKDLRKRVGLPN
jgi:TolB-like protein/Tfp pilus assembly protein PilF